MGEGQGGGGVMHIALQEAGRRVSCDDEEMEGRRDRRRERERKGSERAVVVERGGGEGPLRLWGERGRGCEG